jgi:hypothetical protein
MWWIIVVMMRAPLPPNGCPRAIAPPSGLSAFSSAPISWSQASGTEAKASLISKTPISSSSTPLRASSLRVVARHHEQRSRSVADLRGVAGRDAAVWLEGRLDRGHLLDAAATTYALVLGDGAGFGLDADDLALEAPVVLRGGGPVVRAQGELVELGAGDAPLVGNQLGAGALIREHTVASGEQRAGRILAGQGGAHRHPAHRLDPTGDHDVVVARDQAGRGEVHRLLGGAALTVDRRPGHALRPTCTEDRIAGDVEGLLADLGDTTPDHVIDDDRVDATSLCERAEHIGGQIGRVYRRQSSVALAHGGPDSLDDDRITHDVLPVLLVDLSTSTVDRPEFSDLSLPLLHNGSQRFR